MGKIIYDRAGDEGHRQSYYMIIESIFAAKPGKLWDLILTNYPVLFPMLEDGFGRFLFVSLIRSLTGRITCGLLFRARATMEANSIKMIAKKILLMLMIKNTNIKILAIEPYLDDIDLSKITNDFIYDPQMWDLAAENINEVNLIRLSGVPKTKLGRDLLEKAAGRKIIVSLGVQSKDKGFDYFCDLYRKTKDEDENFMFVSGGLVHADSLKQLELFSADGGVAINRYLSDNELYDLYGLAAYVWGYYRPTYDQASGIFGRAYQFGAPIILRRGSRVQKVAQILSHPHVPADGIQDMYKKICESSINKVNRKNIIDPSILKMESVSKLRAALRV
jgi:hypothetical protein